MLVIGLGNPDRGDDAAGILIARGLAARGIDAMNHRGDMLDLIEIWQTADWAVIVDAVVSGAPIGTVHIWEGHFGRLRNNMFCSSTHALGLPDAIELARALNRLPKKLTIYGIEGAQFAAGVPPSALVLMAVKSTIDRIASCVKKPSS